MIAIADTIKILNDDDALELFKKTAASASSLLQIQVTDREVRSKAFQAVNHLRHGRKDIQLDLIAMALHGKKVSFEKVSP